MTSLDSLAGTANAGTLYGIGVGPGRERGHHAATGEAQDTNTRAVIEDGDRGGEDVEDLATVRREAHIGPEDGHAAFEAGGLRRSTGGGDGGWHDGFGFRIGMILRQAGRLAEGLAGAWGRLGFAAEGRRSGGGRVFGIRSG